MALRARVNSQQVNESENMNVPGFLANKQANNVPERNLLGDIKNRDAFRHGSTASDQAAKEILLKKMNNLKFQAPMEMKENLGMVAALPAKNNVIEPMELNTSNLDLDKVDDIDKDDEDNPQLVSEYVQDIYLYLRYMENLLCIKPNYLQGQKDILPKMRAVLIDWLVGVHMQFRLLPETVYTTVAILDRYLSRELDSVKRNNLQLVGVACMLVAAKYEEIYAPELKDFVYITDSAFTTQEILEMECKVLTVLDFNLGRPLPLHFLRRASKAGGVESLTHTLAKYVLELSLLEYSLAAEEPSRLAAAALALSTQILERDIPLEEVWNATMVHYTKYTLTEITDMIVKLAKVLLAAPNAKLTSIYDKYSSKKFMKIARIPNLDDPFLKEIANGNI